MRVIYLKIRKKMATATFETLIRRLDGTIEVPGTLNKAVYDLHQKLRIGNPRIHSGVSNPPSCVRPKRF